MQSGAFDEAAFRIRQGMDDQKRRRIFFFDDSFNAPDPQPDNHKEKNVLAAAGSPAASLINRHPTIQVIHDSLPDTFALFGNDRDGVVFFDAINQKIDRLRGRHISEDRIERRFNAEKKGRSQKYEEIQNQNDIADLQQIA